MTTFKRGLLAISTCTGLFGALTATQPLDAQIRVHPTGVSTNAMNPTTVFLSFGGLRNQIPAEGIWCGEIVAAVLPDRGQMCDPKTIFGRLPLRSSLDRIGAGGSFTDIMSIPASVARRAFQSAVGLTSGTFFYVRRFSNTVGGASEFVVVTCRLTGGGANVPFSLTNVTVAFETELPVQFVSPGQTPPAFSATVAYNGSGQLRGRWEVVRPGEELPSRNDLLTEATLPQAERGTQRRYTLVDRFNVAALPNGKMTLPGPDPARLPHDVDGTYFVLLRVEASDELAGESDLDAAGAGSGITRNGAVAGFAMPMLRYVLGGASDIVSGSTDRRSLLQLSPVSNAIVARDTVAMSRWTAVRGATFYRVEFETTRGQTLLSAMLRVEQTEYAISPLVAERAAGADVRWRVSGLDAKGDVLVRTDWRRYRLAVRP